jgi:hypothetical protein
MGAEFTQIVTHRLCIVQVIATTAKWGLFMNTNPCTAVCLMWLHWQDLDDSQAASGKEQRCINHLLILATSHILF